MGEKVRDHMVCSEKEREKEREVREKNAGF